MARKILLAFLTFIIVLSITAFFVRNTINKKLASISKLASNVEDDRAKPEHALLLLHESENDFQESLLSASRKKRADYKIKLTQSFNEIDTLLKESADTAHLTSAQGNMVKLWFQKKLKLSDKLYVLKHNFDSLLTVYADFNKEADKNLKESGTNVNVNQRSVNSSTDSILKANNAKKKGLLGRIKDAIINKNNSSVAVKHSNNSQVTDITTQQILTKDKNLYSKKLKELQERNMDLLNKQRELIVVNTRISNELEHIISDVKEINYKMADEFKRVALKNYLETTVLLNKFYLAALSLVLVFAILLILFIIELNKSEQHLWKENERSVAIAQQKMDLLLHMSHEIRNPLTAIKGFLYIFGKSSLSQKQTEMLDSISHSSDMLLRTLNDTLDAAKMESSEFKINNDPFNPDFILKTVIESMEFSATKKGLTIGYNFKGDKEAVLLGDSFRLEQIMTNLLSNAIKYTGTGGVTVNAVLIGAENRLQVTVSDTGAGISLEQQAKLFSKYYQTSSSKGKVGTGLGLFICKQLVEMQGGKITAKSSPDAGTTFSFFIPYQKNDSDDITKKGTDDPLLLLNGISILAVDDNELNLMFLKMMVDKWNVKFHQATNGKEALDLIAENAITVVLTDIEMPEMDGYELLAEIKKLKKPLNQLPVIMISGAADGTDAKKFLKKGFSGIIGKPFKEAELVEQLVKVLKKQA
ncbi:hybrid sensor histidine kinase/response regulator [Mucilaginibacter sp. OK098]|uniref:hybrid sensor histidine kinase/response regulator n=1 Tax=Mucilaginibacter sp. OK098 TaxID=1855297 RepID=UPI001F28FC58|nr:hybrid sensor histidine kinase/response regulator [Mucilaginibacter sp. OK098]